MRYRVIVYNSQENIVYRSGWTTLDAAQKTADWFKKKGYSAIMTKI